MAKILMIDNYDSFTYNLVQYLGELGAEVIVRRNRDLARPVHSGASGNFCYIAS
jgi:anthranilate/para-aminobenzoate synthase component II